MGAVAVRATRDGRVSLARELERLLRPEFRAAVIVPAAGDPILGTPSCAVSGCGRTVAVGRLCNSHHSRWRREGRPELDGWMASTDPATRAHRPLAACVVTGCGRGVLGAGLCSKHHYRWTTMLGRPDMDGWLATVVDDPDDRPACAVGGCELLVESEDPGLCRSHYNRWRGRGRPSLEWFVVECAAFGDPVFDLRDLPDSLRLEVAYGLQCRVDDNRTKIPARGMRPLLRFLASSDVDSVLARPVDQWMADLPAGRWSTAARSFLRYTIQRLEDLVEGEGWEAEYPRDVWLLRRLGYPAGTGPARVRFDRISQPWLRELAKRWARLRLSYGLSISTVTTDIAALTRLSVFLAEAVPSMLGPASLERDVLERYLAWLAVERPGAHGRGTDIGAVAGFLRGVHQHRWAPGLPATAAIYDEDRPRRPKLAPRALSEHVMAQLESDANLARFRDPAYRLVTEILMRTGMRISDVCGLGIDCLVHDPSGAAYLRYRNHKMRREAFVPVDEDLAAAVSNQQALLTDRSTGTCLFPRPTRNPEGIHPLSRGTYVNHLNGWLEACEVRDELGRAVHVTPHQWRHTYATRLVNADVPLEVVRRLLDHTSSEMTDHYARMHDRTVREHWEKARKVSIDGEPIVFDPDSPLADAAWLKDRLARAKIALPNGYCTLPLQKRCEVANACLTCPMFVTTAEFLPQHHEQLDATRELIARAEQQGQERMVEMNRTVETNLLRIITGLEQPDQTLVDDDLHGDVRAG